jgi:hypothetical protein
MASWTLAEARNMLNMWIKAEKAVATSQSYSIGSRSLTRANLAEIRKSIEYWRNEVAALEKGNSNGRRVVRVIPRDL